MGLSSGMTMAAKSYANQKSAKYLAQKKVNLNNPNSIKHLLDEMAYEVSKSQTSFRTMNYR